MRLPSDETIPGQIISVALRNVHIFRPKSSSQLAAGIANLSSYHAFNLPTSEIALLAVDSASSFYWLDRLAAERHTSPHLMNPATTTSNNPLQTILTALRSFHRSHYPVILILNWVPSPISAAGNLPAVQLYKQHLPSSSTLVNRTSLFPDHSRAMQLTHQITLNLTHVVPSSHNAVDEKEQRMASLSHADIHVHVKTAVDHTELLLMQINPEQVIITTADKQEES